MKRSTPDYLQWDSPNFVFRWPRRLAYMADSIERVNLTAICLGFVLGVGYTKGWDYEEPNCVIAGLGSCVAFLLPKALMGTAQLWIRHRGIRLMKNAFAAELPRLSETEAIEHKRLLDEQCAKLMKQTEA